MQLYNTTTKRGLVQEVHRLCDTTDTSYTRLDITARLNDAMEELVGEIITADGTWDYDDTNHTTLPRGKGNLVNAQSQYTFASEYLDIVAVDVLDTSNVYRKLKAFDPSQLGDLSPEEYFGVDGSGNLKTGFPEYYDKQGDSIFLYPAPSSTNVTLTNGLRVWFKRAPNAFTAASDTSNDTTEPGLPSSYHVLLAYMAAIPYCMSYYPERVVLYEKRRDELKQKLLDYYGLRERDSRKTMTMKAANHI